MSGGVIENMRKAACLAWVLTNSKTVNQEYLVLQALANHANEHGRNCWPSQATIHRSSHIPSRNTAIDRIPMLEAAGEIIVARTRYFTKEGEERFGGAGNKNYYAIVMGDIDEDGDRTDHAGEWLAQSQALRLDLAHEIQKGKDIVFSVVPEHLTEQVDELLHEQWNDHPDIDEHAEQNSTGDGLFQDQETARARDARLDHTDNSPGDGLLDDDNRAPQDRAVSANKPRGNRANRPSRLLSTSSLNGIERSSSSSDDTIDLRGVPERSQEEEMRFQKLRGALIGRDGSDSAVLVGQPRDRVRRIADAITDEACDELIAALWNTAPMNLTGVPWLVDWLEDRCGIQPDKPIEVSRREITDELERSRRRLQVLAAQIGDDHDDLPDLVEEADTLRGRIHDLELQLGSLPSSPAAAAS